MNLGNPLDGFVSPRGGKMSSPRRSALLAGEPQRRAAAAFAPAQPRFLARDVVARDRNHTLPLRQLKLEYHHVLLAERHFGRREIELPHPHETLIVELFQIIAVREEA